MRYSWEFLAGSYTISDLIPKMLPSQTRETKNLYPISDQNSQNPYLFSDQTGSKTMPFGATHNYCRPQTPATLSNC